MYVKARDCVCLSVAWHWAGVQHYKKAGMALTELSAWRVQPIGLWPGVMTGIKRDCLFRLSRRLREELFISNVISRSDEKDAAGV